MKSLQSFTGFVLYKPTEIYEFIYDSLRAAQCDFHYYFLREKERERRLDCTDQQHEDIKFFRVVAMLGIFQMVLLLQEIFSTAHSSSLPTFV